MSPTTGGVGFRKIAEHNVLRSALSPHLLGRGSQGSHDRQVEGNGHPVTSAPRRFRVAVPSRTRSPVMASAISSNPQ